ncbi:MAG TPA: ribosome silencing factor [Candidatus Hypogeohydataceae bacterium YC38]
MADSKKAEDILILDLRRLTFFTHYFVICSGFNKRQLQSIAEEIEKQAKVLGITQLGIEGYQDAKWILIDYGDVIVHLFDKETRTFYDLELLWGDASRLSWRTVPVKTLRTK